MSQAFSKALSIAGSDPTGGAGIQMDLTVFAHHGVHGMAVPTALTVQTTKRVHQVLPAFPNVVGEQIVHLLSDMLPDVVKIGMLATDDVLLRVASALDRFSLPRVVDPVLRASDGTWLLERRAFGNLLERICAGATLVTPNLDEAALLTGESDPARAARVFLACGAEAVLVKGGHAEGAPEDLLVTPDETRAFSGPRHPKRPHGTGCALSAAIAARLARGESLCEAVAGAKSFVSDAIARAVPAGSGQGQPLLRFEG